MMRFRMLLCTAAAMLATGCATVNMTEMASPVAVKAEVPAQKNIVLRAATKLYSAFQSKGFVAKTSKKKMQSAASILLNGLEARELTAENDYAAQELSVSAVKADIAFATQHVSQTANAAEVYFELSEGRQTLREELVSLEEALLASLEASATFEKIVGTDSSEHRVLNLEIDRLKRITDNFGQSVRDLAAAELAARRAEVI